MEEYPEELRTPPVALACLVGCPDVHALITGNLHSLQPPINTIALPDFSKISVISKAAKENPAAGSAKAVGGIVKRDWLSKHRTRVPAVVVALFSSDHVSGDPAQWLQVCNNLENIKATIQGRNIKLLVVVVTQSGSIDDTSEDRMISLRKRAEVDSKNLVIFVPDDPLELKQSLNRLGTACAELANAYYRDEGRRVKARLERKNFGSIDLHIRYCFKVAVYAEFRRDWLEALKMYEEAYHALREVVGISTRLPLVQSLVEVKSIAEQFHFKISTLLLHGGKVVEAITWFRRHISYYRRLNGAPEVIFLHWEWLSRQYLVFAQLLETCSVTVQNLTTTVSVPADKQTEWEFYPPYYYQLSAHYLKEKNSCLEFAISMSEDVGGIDGSVDSVVASVYVGQFARLLEHEGTYAMQALTDDEYVRYILAEGKRFQDSFEIIALLKRSFEAYNNLKATRMASYCGVQMAREYFVMGEFSNAKQVFENVASLYRQEGWVTLLWEVLGYLRDCSVGISSVKDFIEYSLEMAAMPIITNNDAPSFRDCCPAGPASLSQREKIHEEAFGVVTGESGIALSENNGLKVNGDCPLYLEIDLVSPLRAVLLASVAFHEQIVKPGARTMITISLRSQLPLNVEIDQLEVQFNQSECNFIITSDQKPHLAAISHVHPGRRVETAPTLELPTSKWLRLTYDIKPDQSGKLECIYVIARIGPNFTICCRAESPASMNDLPLWNFEDMTETIPTKDPGLAFSGQKAIQVEESEPQVDLKLDSSGPALVGESFILPVTVASKGHEIHSGELKINLVDTKGGGLLSPREVEPFLADNLHVELVGISGQERADHSEANIDNIQKIQPSFGLISVPFLNVGDSWSCKLKIKWNRPKPIMVYVSLGYHHSNEPSSQKVHVHKSLQIEGKTAVTISHHFMLPFRRDSLLLSNIKANHDSDHTPSLALNETSILIISAKNCSEVPLRLLSMSFDVEDDDSITIQPKEEKFREPILHVSGEDFKKVFAVIPKGNFSTLKTGAVSLKWQRDSGLREDFHSCSASSQVTKHRLPDVNVELPPLVISLKCPPHAIVGHPFTYSVTIQNQTELLQEIKYSLADSQSFVSSGPHDDSTFVLPKSEHVISYMLVPLGLGYQQLPKVTVTSVRYNAGFQPSTTSSTVFIFPSEPPFSDQ
ncbi:unnamed protein product [Fraxinus pennsylvanica]|uniref:Trafficking protein particle complex subunit 11 n=1 Tax=Fraxinus pennsylvanica TaxID=56036 RepID=A0AAD1ZIT3_9LAMI|nr:unnamed protein product [Fraxinus pennsylvanica]